MSYKKIGKIVSALGLEGKVVLFHELPSGKPLLKLEHLFIELQKGSYIPFFPVEKPVMMNDEQIAFLLDDTNSVEAARLLVGKSVYIESTAFKNLFPKQSLLDENLEGFKITDQTSGISGSIETVFEVPGQLLAKVFYKGKEVLIPLNESFVLSLDVQKKEIKAELPEGIWTL